MNIFPGKFKKTPYIALILLILSFICLVQFPVRKYSSVWKGYRVLAVGSSIEESTVLDRLERAGIDGCVTESNSMLSSPNPMVPVHPVLDEANSRRSQWFISKPDGLRYFYIPRAANAGKEKQTDKKIQQAFAGIVDSWFFEQSPGYSPYPLIVAACLILIGMFLFKKRWFFVLVISPWIVYLWSCNTMEGLGSGLFSILFILYTDKTYEHLNSSLLRIYLRTNPIKPLYFLLMPLTAFLLAVLGGTHTMLLWMLAVISSAGMLVCIRSVKQKATEIRERKRLHPFFTAIPMSPASIVPAYKRGTILGILLITIAFILTGIPFISSNARLVSGGIRQSLPQQLYIPSPSGYNAQNGFTVKSFLELQNQRTERSLPDLGDYIETYWMLTLASMIRIGDAIPSPQKGYSVSIEEWNMESDGSIVSRNGHPVVFDDDFIRKALSLVQTPLDILLLNQGRFTTVTMTRLKE